MSRVGIKNQEKKGKKIGRVGIKSQEKRGKMGRIGSKNEGKI